MAERREPGDWEGAKPAAWKLTKALAQFFGVPLANMEKISNMVVNHVEDIRNGEFGSFEAGVDRTRTQNTRLLYEALQAGDTKKAEKLKEEIGDEKAVRSALKTYIKQIYTEDKQIMKAEVVSLLDIRRPVMNFSVESSSPSGFDGRMKQTSFSSSGMNPINIHVLMT